MNLSLFLFLFLCVFCLHVCYEFGSVMINDDESEHLAYSRATKRCFHADNRGIYLRACGLFGVCFFFFCV